MQASVHARQAHYSEPQTKSSPMMDSADQLRIEAWQILTWTAMILNFLFKNIPAFFFQLKTT